MASGGQQKPAVIAGRSYPIHSNEGGAATDSYVWRKVRLTEETGAGRLVKLEVWDGGAYKLVNEHVFFDEHEHFDPDFLWYSDYTAGAQGSPAVVVRPANVANTATEGWLLVSGAKLAQAGIDTDAESGWKDLGRSPKWPKATG